VDTLIGSSIAVLAVLVSPSAPTAERVVSDAMVPLHRCRDVLVDIGSAIRSRWTIEQAELWRSEALGPVEATTKARREHEEHQLTARWNARARRQWLTFGTILAMSQRILAEVSGPLESTDAAA
jgi:hypothetical protein